MRVCHFFFFVILFVVNYRNFNLKSGFLGQKTTIRNLRSLLTNEHKERGFHFHLKIMLFYTLCMFNILSCLLRHLKLTKWKKKKENRTTNQYEYASKSNGLCWHVEKFTRGHFYCHTSLRLLLLFLFSSHLTRHKRKKNFKLNFLSNVCPKITQTRNYWIILIDMLFHFRI